ncbi:Myosin type-2 heavy chain 1 [Massospora cicadina]|nr:Myosin type-2 heavy chain 1 [Massospora cicadina]
MAVTQVAEVYSKVKVIDDEGNESVYETAFSNPKLPPLRNPPILEGIDDLTNLSYLHEPGVLHNISVRYAHHTIYTYSGIVLIAINPFQKVSLYSQEVIKAYSGKGRGDLEPHLFAIAEDAYRCMIKDEKNQTVIVSGESGAGKTVSAKFIMRYFASVNLDSNSSGGGDSSMSETERQILATNPILESFGNAKTTRNDNSSRFGKYIEIQFDTDINIIGARIRTYLLERSRLIFQPESERNYHIFYQICEGADEAQKEQLHLSNAQGYHYLNQGGQGSIPGVDDAEEFKITREALETIGINAATQWEILRLCAALLHIGNIQIGGNDKSGANILDTDEALAYACELLKINASEFRRWVMKKQIVTRSDKIISNLSPAQATVVRDSAAKFLYSNLFNWLIDRINEKLANGNETQVRTFIGVLDIYGFEHFQKNSFEQFCINYANEKLQQQFNQHVFKLEQEEYVREEINWTFIDFSDNKPCIEIIEGKLGILALLDEQSRLPSGSDEGFVNKLYTTLAVLENERYFSKPRFGNTAFTVSHYAHDVTYESESFLEKNRDTVPDEILAVLQNSDAEFVNLILPTQESQVLSPKANGRPSATKRQTLGSAFKLSLSSLMETIGDTNVHYIRCIKPNEDKAPWCFENKMVLAQLRACGVLETIRISCSGYPSRKVIEEFVQRYYIILPHAKWGGNVVQVCKAILEEGLKDPDKYQLVFFRAGQLAYLEKLRSDKINNTAIFIQKNVRRMLCRRYYLRLRFTSIVCRAQNVHLAVRNLKTLFTRANAARMLQAAIRGSVARKAYRSRLDSTIRVQTYCRGYLARRDIVELKKRRVAIKVQSLSRKYLAHKRYLHLRKLVILLQSCYRRVLAKKELKRRKLEARSINHLKESSLKLENKIISISQQLASKEQDLKELNRKTALLDEELLTWKKKYEKIEASNRELLIKSDQLLEQERELQAVRRENSELQKRCQDQSQTLQDNERQLMELRETIQVNEQRSVDPEEIVLLKSEISELKRVLEETKRARQTLKEAPLLDAGSATASYTASAVSHRHSDTFGFSPSSDTVTSPTHHRRNNRTSLRSVDLRGMRGSWNPLSSLFQPAPADLPEVSEDNSENLQEILESDALVEEVVTGLIEKLNIPLPNFEMPRRPQEILLPAHMIGLCIIQMYKFDLGSRIGGLVSDVLSSVRGIVERAEGDFIFAFWFSNMAELLAILLTASNDVACSSPTYQPNDDDEHLDPQEVVADAVKGLNVLLAEIMTVWLKDLQKRLGKMAIPAVVENQSLPGFVSNDAGFFNKIIGQGQNSITIDHALNFFSILNKTLNYYFVDKVVVELLIEYLLSFVGILSFNHIIMRKNFCSWKRGMQIQYNVTRLEEWCSSKAIDQQSTNLEQLMQAAKLLQLQKATLQDLEILYDVCHLLNPGQIKKLVSIYHLSEYENPISPDILKEVARRAALTEKADVLFLEALPHRIPLDYRSHFSGKSVEVEKFPPNQVSLPRLKYILQTSN